MMIPELLQTKVLASQMLLGNAEKILLGPTDNTEFAYLRLQMLDSYSDTRKQPIPSYDSTRKSSLLQHPGVYSFFHLKE